MDVIKLKLHLFDIGKICIGECETAIKKERDEFAIGFAEWLFDQSTLLTTEELLEIYKHEKRNT